MRFSYKNLKITQKLLLFVLPLVVVLILVLGYMSSSISREALRESEIKNLENVADLKISKLEDLYARTYDNISLLQKSDAAKSKLVETDGEENPPENLIAKKPTDFLSSFAHTYGYYSIKLLDRGGNVVYSTLADDVLGVELGDPENEAFTNGKEAIFFSKIFKRDELTKIVVSAPILSKNKFFGVVAIELDMDAVYELVQEASDLGETGEILFGRKTQSGALFLNTLKHDDHAALFKEVKNESVDAAALLKAVNGNALTGIFSDYRGKEVIAVSRFSPSFKWGVVVKKDTVEAFASIHKIQLYTLVVSIIMLIIASILSLSFANKLVTPIIKLKDAIIRLGEGNTIEYELEKKGEDEIGDMIDATNNLSKFQKNVINFSQNIGKGVFDADTNIDETKGLLGASLTTMSANLQEVAKADQKRNWTTVGLAKFAEILRVRDENIDELSDTIITNLIKYLNANQGSIFILNDDESDEHLDLTATYAWDRKKHKQKEVLLGEGLVGRCWQEAEKIYLTDIPEDYITITSGLGDASPRCILIIPMKIEEKVFGVIEIASFNEIEEHQIEFIEKLAESIATTISNTRINHRTSYLLEESKEMTEEMRAQEEEMRQNMEEMQATQEEMARTQEELTAKEASLNSLINNTKDSIIAIDSNYNVTTINRTQRERYVGTQYEGIDVGAHALDMLGDVRDEWKGYYDQALAGEKLNFIIKSSVKGELTYREYFIYPMYSDSDVVGCSIFSREVLDHIDESKFLKK